MDRAGAENVVGGRDGGDGWAVGLLFLGLEGRRGEERRVWDFGDGGEKVVRWG